MKDSCILVGDLEVEEGLFERREFLSKTDSYCVRFSSITKRCVVYSCDGLRLFEVGLIRNLRNDKYLDKLKGVVSLYENTPIKGEMFYA